MLFIIIALLYFAAFILASPVPLPATLNQEAYEEAHHRDETATRAFSDIQIKTSDGRCLYVEKTSGDFRANLTPIQVADCGTTDGQGWDFITKGEHNDKEGYTLIVSTLTQACFNADPRRKPGSQINLFSCGGRADGSGEVTDSQLWKFDGGKGPLGLTPMNGEGFCLFAADGVIDVDNCSNVTEQVFTLAG
ncbi:unnamed protein product [Clonostachys solani]|uniref:Ricin B lectin domain-containing protein n=1 Tax=Clonostachys solani TaxID=160281 RepID=A0A9N9W5W3_9HYPO|nr:unnamed protein product [Clonostachys solani]